MSRQTKKDANPNNKRTD